MKIGILNLALDNNYGGNLQRFALITYLLRQGHDVKHIPIRCTYSLPWYKKPYSYTKRVLKKYVFHKRIRIREENQQRMECLQLWENTKPFYEKYIPHTKVATNKKQLIEIVESESFDVIVVGSDQVWRKSMTASLGLSTFMLDFVKDDRIKKIAYAISLGVDCPELQPSEAQMLKRYYEDFYAVSVREISALDLFNQYGWNKPQPEVCVDPTLLLNKEDYIQLINANPSVINRTCKKIFCYILDDSTEKQTTIASVAAEKELDTYQVGLKDKNYSIEQWLNDIYNSEVVITDSYHGVVFSIIFNRDFIYLGNNRRGNTRICSLFSLMKIKENSTTRLEYQQVNSRVKELKENSSNYLTGALNNN